MKIAVDSGPLASGHKVRGIGFYTKNLLGALGKKAEAVDVSTADLSRYDLIHIPYFNPYLMSFPRNITKYKFIVTIPDLIPLIYPKHYPPGIKGRLNFLRQKRILKKARAIITISETSKKDIVRSLGIPAEKVFVTYLAPAKHFKALGRRQKAAVKKKYKLPDKFVLYVGDVNYNKNIPGLVEACKIAKIALVICGKQAAEVDTQNLDHRELRHLKPIINDLKNNKNIIRLGFVPDEDLVAIYNLATLYCQLSFYEGFGLPVLEAIACGTPVIAAKTQALVEIAEGAATFVNPKDPKSIAAGFRQLVKNPKLPREYSWGKTARQTLEIYRNV